MNDIFNLSKLSWCDGRYVQDLGTNSPFLADKRLLFIPTSCFRVTENNPNWGSFYRFASIFIVIQPSEDSAWKSNLLQYSPVQRAGEFRSRLLFHVLFSETRWDEFETIAKRKWTFQLCDVRDSIFGTNLKPLPKGKQFQLCAILSLHVPLAF